ncbi:MAG: hypothetical protein ACTHN0_03025 [Aquihabitans sp.]
MGFFKPAGDDASDDGSTADDDVAAGEQAGGDGGLSASAEGEGSDGLEDLGVDLDAGPGFDDGSSAAL